MLVRRFESLVDRFFAADHGLLRLRFAARTVCSLGMALLLLWLVGFGFKTLLIGAVTSMFCSTTLRTGTPWQRGAYILLFLPVMAVSFTAATFLGPHPIIGDVVFVLLMFTAIYVRRFGPLGFGLGMAGFISFFFATFIGAAPSALPGVWLAMAIGAASCALMTLVVFRENPQSMLRRAMVSARAQFARLIEELAKLLEDGTAPEAEDVLPRAISRQTERLHATTLQIEDDVESIGLTQQWQRQLVDSELAADRLARSVARAMRAELDAETRTQLVDDLRGLHRFVDRDPAAALAVDTDELLMRISRYDIRGDPSRLPSEPRHHTLLVHRAIREVLLSVVQLRKTTLRIQESEASTPAPDERRDAESESPQDGMAISTRNAFQAALGGTMAIVGGELLSDQRWYWAVISGFVVFAGTTSRGDLLVKGWRRVWGTIAGIVFGTVLGTVLHGQPVSNLAVLLACVFFAFYSLRASYGLMTFFITTMLAMLYDLMGTFSGGVLVLRLEETAIGVASSMVAAMILLPKRTRSTVLAAMHEYFEALHEQLEAVQRLLVYRDPADLLASTREVDRAADELRGAVQPMTHPMSPARVRRGQAYRLRTLVDESATAARNLARAAEPGMLAGLPAGIRTLRRLAGNAGALAAATENRPRAPRLRSGPALGPTVDVRALAAINDEGVPDRLSVLHLRRTVNTLDRLDKVLLGMAPALEQTIAVPSDTDHRTDQHPAQRG